VTVGRRPHLAARVAPDVAGTEFGDGGVTAGKDGGTCHEGGPTDGDEEAATSYGVGWLIRSTSTLPFGCQVWIEEVRDVDGWARCVAAQENSKG
jgi:hypothetical protein